MRTFFGVALLAFGLVVMPVVANGAPIGPNACGTEAFRCDLYADYETDGPSVVETDPFGGYLVAYTFLINEAANLADGWDESDVAHILVIHDDFFELFSKSTDHFNTAFSSIFSDALALAAIDGTSLSNGQILGFPVVSGVLSLNGIGYFTTADEVSMLVNYGDGAGNVGGQDPLTIHTALPPDTEGPPPTGVPEPGTLSLLGLGFASLTLRRRKAVR